MAEPTPDGAVTPAPTAGSLLRKAREAQGLHIAMLAASLKIPQRKLEALERDRLDELPDVTFARALAQTVCRALKIDAEPVLALLPRAGPAALDQVSAGLNTPFRDRPAAIDPAVGQLLRHPATAIVLVLAAAALAVWFWPRAGDDRMAPTSTEMPPTRPPARRRRPCSACASAWRAGSRSATLPDAPCCRARCSPVNVSVSTGRRRCA